MNVQTEVAEGAIAPDFTAETTDGSYVSLHDFQGKSNVVLYFYPEDMTGGCTVEAQRFRDDKSKYDAKNTVILGVSLDDRAKHEAFTKKENLNFPLIVDSDRSICNNYNVPIDGHQPFRQTFLIDKNGKIAKAYRKVDARTHSENILRDMETLNLS